MSYSLEDLFWRLIGALGFNAFKFYAMLIPTSLTAASAVA